MSVIIQRLTKKFGDQKAVDEISFEVNRGEILGFLGPNGAGKSTTMRIAACYLPPTTGKVYLAGMDVTENPLGIKRKVGYLPEHNPLYYDMYVKEYLSFIASLHQLTGRIKKEKINEMILLTGLSREKRKKIGQLSKGYKQRVGLAQSMIHDPEVLILDEPTSGLDPNQIVEIRELIRQISKNKTVIFSTHVMQEVQALCDRVVIIDQGKIVADDRVINLKNLKSDKVTIVAEFESTPDLSVFNNIRGIHQIKSDGTTLKFIADRDKDIRAAIFNLASRENLTLIGLTKEEESLEDVFQKLTIKERRTYDSDL
jgi:ABC-2 type transport system ATP-binding protein